MLAFKGAPASFPVLPENRGLQRYVMWNQRMEREAADYINNTFGQGTPFIGVHLRMGSDWVSVSARARAGAGAGTGEGARV